MNDVATPKTPSTTEIPDGPADESTGLRPRERASLKARLEAESVAVRERLRMHFEAINDTDREVADEMEQASRDQNEGFLLGLAEKERKLLEEVSHALRKFDSDEYGLCEGTGEPVGFGRLNVRPWARYSIAYKEELERESPRGR